MYTRWIAVEQEPGFANLSRIRRCLRPGHGSLLRRDPVCKAGLSPHAFLLQTPRFELFREFLTLFTHELVEEIGRASCRERVMMPDGEEVMKGQDKSVGHYSCQQCVDVVG